MSREIKFRGWALAFNCWVHGLPTYISTGTPGSILPDTYLSSFVEGGACMKITLQSLMQYTGLKDKNGKEIYEGDILKPIAPSYQEGNRAVEFLDGSFCYSLSNNSRSTKGKYSALTSTRARLFEVIGNIYENPELCNA